MKWNSNNLPKVMAGKEGAGRTYILVNPEHIQVFPSGYSVELRSNKKRKGP